MPVEFLTQEQQRRYGRFPDEPTDAQLARHFHLDDADKSLIAQRRGDHNRLGFALQLTTVRFLGTFLPDPTDVPSGPIYFVARQIGVKEPDCLPRYLERKPTRHAHRTEIQRRYGYHDFNNPYWRFRLIRWLYARAWIGNERPSLLFVVATAWLIQNKVLLPGATTLSRLISQIKDRASERLWHRLAGLPNDQQKAQLLELLNVPDDERTSLFDMIRRGPVHVSGPSFVTALERYQHLRDFELGSLDLSSIPPARLKTLARYAGLASMHKIARMPDERRIATLVAFVRAYEVMALDDALDVLDLLITEIGTNAKRIGQKNRLRNLKDLDKAALALARACTVLLDDAGDPDKLREAVFAKVTREQLSQSIADINELARPSDDNFHNEMVAQYQKVRRFLPRLLQAVRFEAAPAGAAMTKALVYLADNDVNRRQYLNDAPRDIVTKPWRRLVFAKKGQIDRRGYTLCVLDRLQDSLRRRDVYVPESDRWGDPRAKLLQGAEWEANRLQVCRSLDRPIKADTAMQELTVQLDTAYQRTAAQFDQNHHVQVDAAGKRHTLTIANLDKVDEPSTLLTLREQVTSLLPQIDLTELLLEIHAKTGFADEFNHVSEASARASDLPVSICAVLLAKACNIGLEPLIKPGVPALTRHRLNWAKQNYIRAETLAAANTRLVDHHATLKLAGHWGDGEVASADGMRFVTPVRTVNAGPNRKYFGSDRGITWYNFISDQYSGFHGIVVPGTLRDSIFVLEGLLEQQTGLNPTEIMTDTAGVSDLVFGLFWLLGYQFSPRLADAGDATFWRIDTKTNYGALDGLARNIIKAGRITDNWDDMLRIAGSLKLGTVQASELIKSLLRSERPSSLAKAIIEVGRINKTIYLLNYIDDEEYRRRILTQLNRGEARHAVARVICHGQRGEIRKRYREGQEDQLGALGLVTNTVVLWNTIYMEASLNHLRQQSAEASDEDIARLSPLHHGHINMLGRYAFTLPENIARGELRPLNQPDTEIAQTLA